ncbi:hypothetical protein [Bartonella tamiae]|uniref:Lipoprotein n=1 Tax=Bartonella tamiae Th239 TaxID=1094558 RepID=J0R049_9HYPH|nr:hypothetical protein [Bartonella tamiae]EJF88879.1 hypothetical protein ME5_01430 [Bartonella tamiae Th239]EJF94871.1 hypothetical protein MEG_00452 [Bartonella tamiae Th307]
MFKPSILARGVSLCVFGFVIVGCARGTEFAVTDQPGANRQGQYPKFTIRPKAATEQFSEEERQKLTESLDNKARALRNVSSPSMQPALNQSKTKEDALREAEETLRKIEQGEQ